MKVTRKIVTLLLVLGLALQPLGYANAQETTQQDPAPVGTEGNVNTITDGDGVMPVGEMPEGDGENEVTTTKVFTGFQLDDSVLSQETTVGSEYTVNLPTKVMATYNLMEGETLKEENLTEEVEVTWSEVEGKVFGTEAEGSYSYQASLVDTGLVVAESLVLPKATVKVENKQTETQQITKENVPQIQSSVSSLLSQSTNGLLGFTRSDIPYVPADNPDFKWEYTEYTGTYVYEFQVVHNVNLEPGAKRTIVFDIDPNNNGETNPLVVDAAGMTSFFIVQSESGISSDKRSVVYTIDNDSLEGTQAIISISLKASPYFDGGVETTYYHPEGTLASNIGVMLLANPNADLGVEVREYVAGTTNTTISDDKIISESIARLNHTIKRDDHLTSSELIIDQQLVSSNKTEITDKSITDLYLGSDGYLYFRDETTGKLIVTSRTPGTTVISEPHNWLTYTLVDEDHSPIGDVVYNLPIPEGFHTGTNIAQNSMQLKVVTLSDYVSVIPYSWSVYSSFSNSRPFATELTSSQNTQMLTGIKDESGQVTFSTKVTGNYDSSSIEAHEPLFTYNQLSYLGDEITVDYKQVVSNPDESIGGYIVEDKKQSLGNIQINIPHYEYKDLIQMAVSIPEKVNADDPTGMEYAFSIYNNVNSTVDENGNTIYNNSNIENNIAPYFHNNGQMKVTFNDDNFTPETLTLKNEYGEFISYYIEYADGSETETINLSAGEFTIDTPKKEDTKVQQIVFNISENGLVKTDKATGYSSGGHFTGTFTEPASDDKIIVVDVTFESAGNQGNENRSTVIAPKQLTWEYVPGIDYLHVAQSVNNQELLINDDPGYDYTYQYLYTGIAIPYEMKQSSVVYTDLRIDLFDTSRLTSDAEGTAEQKAADVKVLLAQLKPRFTFYGNHPSLEFSTADNPDVKIWYEYTTNFNSEVRKFYVEDNIEKDYAIPLQDGEYFTSMVFCTDRLRLLGADTVDLTKDEQQIDYVEMMEMGFIKVRHEDMPIITPEREIPTKALATANGLGDTWIPSTSVGTEHNDDKRYSSSYKISNRVFQEESKILVYTDHRTFVPDYSDHQSYSDNVEEIVLPSATAAGGYLGTSNQKITIPMPLDTGFYHGNYSEDIYFAEGSAVYLQLNTEQFRYVGYDEKIKMINHDGKTWLRYDLSEHIMNNGSNQQGEPFYISADHFYVTTAIDNPAAYRLFLDSYMDIGPTLALTGLEKPYFTYSTNTTLKGFMEENPDNLKDIVDYSHTEAQFVKMNTLPTVFINTATTNDIKLFPGIENKADYVDRVTYNIHEYDDLVLSFELGSTERAYRDYHMVIELPREGVSYQNSSMTEPVISDESLYLRTLDTSSVLIDEDLKEQSYTIQYASAVTFDTSNSQESQIASLTTATTTAEARYVVISFVELPVGSVGRIDLKLIGDADSLYLEEDGTYSYASVETRFEFTEPNNEAMEGYHVGTAYAPVPAEFKFEWVRLQGTVYEEEKEYIPDGLYAGYSRDSKIPYNDITFLNLNQLDENNNPIQMKPTYHSHGYELLLKPMPVSDGLAPYNLVLDLEAMGKQGTHVMSLNTTDHVSYEINNNAPRTLNDGIHIYTDAEGLTASRDVNEVAHASDYEIENGYVNFAMYINPTLTLNPTITELEKGTTETIQATVEGQGYLQEESVYVPVDGSTYGTVSSVLAEDKRNATIDLTGMEITFDETAQEYVYKDATSTLVNYFGEEVEVTSKYLVFIAPKVTFHTTDKDVPEVKGAWTDETTEESKDVKLSAEEGVYDEGTMTSEQVPALTPPLGYEFKGWQDAEGNEIIFSEVETTLSANTNLYPIFEEVVDTLVDKDEEDLNGDLPGDGIPDKYQATVSHIVTNGIWEEAPETTTTSEVVTFKDVDGKFSDAEVATAIYTVPTPEANTGYGDGAWRAGNVSTGTVARGTGTGDFTFYYDYQVNTYNVVFDKNTGEGSMPNQEMVYGVEENLNTNTFAKADHIFMGWSTTQDGDVEYTDAQSVKNLTAVDGGTVTLYAVWEKDVLTDLDKDGNGELPGDGIPDKYQTTVNHVVTNGTWNGQPDTTVSEVVTFVDAEGQPSNEADATAEFEGQTSTGNIGYTTGAWEGSTPTGSITYTPDEVTYTYEYDANNYQVAFHPSGASGEMSNQRMVYDVEAALSVNEFTKEDHMFMGWSTTENGTTVTYANEEEVRNLTDVEDGVVDLYAVWEKDVNKDNIPDKYQVKFIFEVEENGGSASLGTETIDAANEQIVFYKTKLKEGVEDTPENALNPENWDIYADVTLTDAEVPGITADAYYDFEHFVKTTSINSVGEQVATREVIAAGVYTEAEVKFVANFKEQTYTVILQPADAGQDKNYVSDEEIEKLVPEQLTDDDLKDDANHIISTPDYGYEFEGWADPTDKENILYETDADLKNATFGNGDEIVLQPQYSKLVYEVNFAIKGDTDTTDTTYVDPDGNNLTNVVQKQNVPFETTLGEAGKTLPTTHITTGAAAQLYEFGYWQYVMEVEGGKTIQGQVESLEDFEVLGNVTFTAVFLKKPAVTIIQQGNATVASTILETKEAYEAFELDNLTTWGTSTTDIEFKDVDLGTNYYDAAVGFKADANYLVKTVRAHYYSVNATAGTSTLEVVTIFDKDTNDGAVNTASVDTLKTELGGADVVVDMNNGTIKIDNIGGAQAEPDGCVVIFEVITEKIKHTITFETADNGALKDPAESSVEIEHGEDGLEFPEVTPGDGYTLDKWVDEEGNEVTPEDLANTPVEEDAIYTAKFAPDANGDNIPDKYQTTITYKSVNGKFGETDTVVEWVTFFDEDGKWSEAVDAVATMPLTPTSTANSGYQAGSWNVDSIPTTITKTQGPLVYTYTHNPIIPTVSLAVTEPTGIGADVDAVTVKKDKPVTLTATGSSKGAKEEELTYQWYEKVGEAETLITGATSATYVPPTNVLGTKTYIVKVTDTRNGQTATSEVGMVTVEPYTVTIDPNGGTFPDETSTPKDVETGNDKTLEEDVTEPTKPGYVLEGWEEEGKPGETITTEDLNKKEFEEDTTVTAKWEKDEISDPEEDENPEMTGDGVADKYQKEVTFEVVGGTWSDDSEEAKKDVVTFEKDGKPSDDEAATGTLQNIPAGKDKDGYTSSWDVTPPTEAVTKEGLEETYTLTFTPNEYTVVFDKNDNAAIGTMSDQEFTYDQPENLNSNAYENEGKVFTGWAIEPTGDVVYADGQSVENLTNENGGEVTLYAVWEDDVNGDKIPDKYQTTVTYNTVGGTWDGTETSKTEWVTFYDKEGNLSETGTATLPSTPDSQANSGYSEDGSWDVTPPTSITKEGGAPTYTFTHDPIVPEVSLEVTIPTGVGADVDEATVQKDKPVTLTATGSSEGATEEELSYQWYEVVDGKEMEIEGATATTYEPPTDELGTKKYVVKVTDSRNNQTATSEEATVNVIPYTVTIDPNGGTFPDGTADPKDAETDNDKTLKDDVTEPTKPGYVLEGWEEEGKPGETITTEDLNEKEFEEDTKVTAKWEKDEITDPEKDNDPETSGDGVADKYQKEVTFEVVGGTWDDETTDTKTDVVTFEKDGKPSDDKDATGTLNVPTGAEKPGYTGSWDVTPPSESTREDLNDSYTLTYVPNEYEVEFDPNGGTGSMNNQDFVYDVAEALDKNSYTYGGKTFLGWSTNPNATAPEFTDQQEVKNLTTKDGEVITLYAVWQDVPQPPVNPPTGGGGTTPTTPPATGGGDSGNDGGSDGPIILPPVELPDAEDGDDEGEEEEEGDTSEDDGEDEEEGDDETEDESDLVVPPITDDSSFDKVEVDGNELDEDDYTIDEDGNLIIKLDYIKTLPDGEHVVRVESDGEVYEAILVVDDGVPTSMGVFERIGGAWSLFDLIMTILAVVFAIGYTIIRPRKRKEDEEEETATDDEEEEEKKHKKRILTSGILTLLAVFNIILFIITQDLTQPMIIFDIYSIIFALVVIAQVVIMFFIRKKNDEEDDEEQATSH